MAQGAAAALNTFTFFTAFFVGWTNFSHSRVPLNLETTSLVSPNRELVATFVNQDDGWCHLEIRNRQSELIDDSAKAQLTPIYLAEWTADSKTIITIGHVAHGSVATMFHDKDGGWVARIIYPPSKATVPDLFRTIYEVSKVQVDGGEIDLTYEVGLQTNDQQRGLHTTDYFTTFMVDPSSGRSVELSRTPLVSDR
jgi:hypothetical protein